MGSPGRYDGGKWYGMGKKTNDLYSGRGARTIFPRPVRRRGKSHFMKNRKKKTKSGCSKKSSHCGQGLQGSFGRGGTAGEKQGKVWIKKSLGLEERRRNGRGGSIRDYSAIGEGTRGLLVSLLNKKGERAGARAGCDLDKTVRRRKKKVSRSNFS